MFTIRSLVFTSVIFFALELGRWVFNNQPELMPAVIAICAGVSLAYIFKIMEG